MYLSVRGFVPEGARGRPLLLVHGAANSAIVWTHWQRVFAVAGWASYALDLRGHGASDPVDLSYTAMEDYLQDIRTVAATLPACPVVAGWSMGGLLAIQAAAAGVAHACLALAPSAPARKRQPDVVLGSGVYDAAEYGILSRDPAEQSRMADLDLEERALALASLGSESRRARAERTAGVVVETCPVPLLIVTGSEDPDWGADKLTELHLDAERMDVPGASHWGLVLSRRALAHLREPVLTWLDRVTATSEVT
ncbi:MAG: alpha/beta hydrolase [Dehalococcoidia bacterium]